MVVHGEKLLLFGGLYKEYLNQEKITSNLNLAEKKLGVHFKEIPTEELQTKLDNLNNAEIAKAKKLAEEIIGNASRNRKAKPPCEADVEKATRLYVAMCCVA